MRLTLLLVMQERCPTDIGVSVVEDLIQLLWAYPIYFFARRGSQSTSPPVAKFCKGDKS